MKTNKVLRFFTSFFVLFTISFSLTFIAKIVIDALVFSQKTLTYNYMYLELIVILVVAILLTLFYQINRISLFVQVIVTYVMILIDIYFFGFISGWFSFNNLVFLIVSISFNIVGLAIISTIVLLNNVMKQKKLNEELKHYKEDNYEEN